MKTQNSATFMEVSEWKTLLGIQKMHLMFNPETEKFCLSLDNTRRYIRIDNKLVIVNNVDKSKSKINKAQEIAILIDEGSDPSDLDAICLVAVKATILLDCDSI